MPANQALIRGVEAGWKRATGPRSCGCCRRRSVKREPLGQTLLAELDADNRPPESGQTNPSRTTTRHGEAVTPPAPRLGADTRGEARTADTGVREEPRKAIG